MILPISTSNGRVGMDRRFSIVPRSRSRVMARPVMMTMVIVSTTPIRPGTMLYCVIASGLYIAWMRRSIGPLSPARNASGPLRSFCNAVFSKVRKAPRALLAAAGSVASASTRMAGRSPRRRSRVKFSGIFTTNWTSPRASASRPSDSLATCRTKSK